MPYFRFIIFTGPLTRPHLFIQSLYLRPLLPIKFILFNRNWAHFDIQGLTLTLIHNRMTQVAKTGRERWVNRWLVTLDLLMGLIVVIWTLKLVLLFSYVCIIHYQEFKIIAHLLPHGNILWLCMKEVQHHKQAHFCFAHHSVVKLNWIAAGESNNILHTAKLQCYVQWNTIAT